MHLIHKHIFDIDVERKDLAYQVHNMLGDVMNHSFYPKLNDLLDKYDRTGETLCFDKIVFDVKTISVDNWQDQLVETMLIQMEHFLQEHISLGISGKDDVRFVRSNSNHMVLEELLFSFLRTGYLPLNPLAKTLRDVEDGIVCQSDLILQLRKLFQENDRYWKRFVFNLSETWLVRVLSFMHSTELRLWPSIQCLTELLKKTKAVNSRTEVSIQLFLLFFHPESQHADVWAKKLIRFTINDCQVVLNESFYDELERLLNDTKGPLGSELRSSFPLLFKVVEEFKLTRSSLKKENDIAKLKKQKNIVIDESESNDGARGSAINHEEEYYVENAGLVLLHPFLSSLFEKLSYLDDQGMLLYECIHSASAVLQYAALGEEKVNEPDLLLNKILCGVEPSTLIYTHIDIGAIERDVMRNLLTAVIEHWKILKNTSVDSLRNTFIKRAGKIVILEDYYELTIENTAVDILLEGLPWGISYIQLPWMLKPLHVNWRTN